MIIINKSWFSFIFHHEFCCCFLESTIHDYARKCLFQTKNKNLNRFDHFLALWFFLAKHYSSFFHFRTVRNSFKSFVCPLCVPRKAISYIAPTTSVVIVKEVYTLIFFSSLPEQRGVQDTCPYNQRREYLNSTILCFH